MFTCGIVDLTLNVNFMRFFIWCLQLCSNDVCTCWAIKLQCCWPVLFLFSYFDLTSRPSTSVGYFVRDCLFFKHNPRGKKGYFILSYIVKVSTLSLGQ